MIPPPARPARRSPEPLTVDRAFRQRGASGVNPPARRRGEACAGRQPRPRRGTMRRALRSSPRSRSWPRRSAAAARRAAAGAAQPADLGRAAGPAALRRGGADLLERRAPRQYGRAPLATDPRLSQAAADHARNMARLRTHSHELPVRGQANLKQRMRRQSVAYRLAGGEHRHGQGLPAGRPADLGLEPRAAPSPTATPGRRCRSTPTRASPSRWWRRWLASPGHRASLLSRRFARLGAGFGVDPAAPACGDLYLVQTFAD